MNDYQRSVQRKADEVKKEERERDMLTEQRLQTLHLEHIARQSENVALVLTLLVRTIAPDEAKAELCKLLDDFKHEASQWRDRFEYVTIDGRRDS